jgi:5-methylcytosine-specific restriction protein A
MIPKNIDRNHITRAIEDIDQNGIPPDRHSVKWSVKHQENLYPPKYLISIANIHANGDDWDPSEFSGGDETNNFLISLGFNIVNSSSKPYEFPVESHSWKAISETVSIKSMDKSSLLHHGTGVPFKLRPFFGLEAFEPDDRREIIIRFRDEEFNAHFEMDKQLRRMRLFWKSDFADTLKDSAPEWYDAYSTDTTIEAEPPIMRFKKADSGFNLYDLEIIRPGEIKLDVEAEIAEEREARTEGAAKRYFGKRYERDPKNRKIALEIHGTVCVICGFDFEKVYGERGMGFIEVHHTEPLSSSDEAQTVNPETDLIPVCANCHRIIHRRRDKVLNIEEMKLITSSLSNVQDTIDE